MMRYWLPLLLCLLPLGAFAQDGIHHCIGADGNPVFTDQPCAALKATPVRNTPDVSSVQTVPASLIPLANTPPPVLCATTAASLRQSMMEAFASRNPNRLAGLMLWNGYGRDAVVADIRSLGSLMQRPLLDIGGAEEEPAPTHTDDVGAATSAPDAPTSPAPSANRQLVVRTAGDDGSGVPRETRFDVVHRSGCLWLRGPD